MQQQVHQYVLELQLLFYIHSEVIDNEDVSKILWNENIKSFQQLIGIKHQINLLGLYGTLSTIKNFIFQKCGRTIKESNEIINHQNRGMLCLTKHESTYFIAFVAPEQYYLKDRFEESVEIALFRYLKDLCNTILLLPSEGILNGWKELNYHYYQNTTNVVQDFKIKERQDFDIAVSQVQLKIDANEVQNLSELKFSQQNIRCTSHKYIINEQSEKFLKIFEQCFIDEPLTALNDFQEQPESVKSWIIEFHQSLKEQVAINKITLLDLIMKNKFDQEIPQEIPEEIPYEIHEITFNFCWKRQSIILENQYDEDEFGLFQSIISKSQYFIHNGGKNNQSDWITTPEFLSQFKTVFQNCFIKIFDKISMQQNFIRKVQDQITKIYMNRRQVLLVDRYQFNAYPRSEFIAEMETRFQRIQQLEIILNDYESYEKIQVQYFFQTQQNQNMFIIKLEKNNKYQYIWVQLFQNQKLDKIFTFHQQSNSLLFYYEYYQTSLYIFNTQMGTTVLVYDEEKKKIIQEKSKKYFNGCEIYIELCYLQYYTCFLLLGQDLSIYKLIRESNQYEKLDISQGDVKYTKLLSTGIGYYYCLANQKCLNIYNFNNQQIQHIIFSDYGYTNINCLLAFHKEDDWYLIALNQQQQLSLQIKNINTSQQIVSIQQEQQEMQYSNPYLDLIKGSIVKFGPSLQLLPTTNNIKTELMIQHRYFECLNTYYLLLQINETDQLLKRDIFQQDGQKVQFSDFYQVLISRVPVQLCTIEKSMLIPLNKGQIQQRALSQQKKIQILQKVYELDFSVIEMTKNFSHMKIYIISIMGKQSSGKSYLLNRIFGTRFGVSSARCTDGIWISFSIVDNILFFLLDCEGLFGSRRTDDEETMLLTFITSISDATILNQDLSFDRHLNKQLNKLTNLTQQVSGQNLFHGQLFIAVRDVNQQEQGGARKELLANIQQIKNSQKTSNFISKLFTDRFQLLLMSHFQAQPFESDIITFRQKLLQNANESNNNWKDSSQLMKIIKIMLVQLELQDYRSLDEIEEEDNINNLRVKTIDLWHSYHTDQQLNFNFQNKNETYQKLFYIYYHNQEIPSSIQYHQFLDQIELKKNIYLKNRAKAIKLEMQLFLNQIKDKQLHERKSKEIDDLLENLVDKFKMCSQICENCLLQCSLRKNHEKKVIQYKKQLEENINKNIQDLNELTDRFNECDKIQFASHQQLMEEKEIINNQIKYYEEVQNMKKIIQLIQRITQVDFISSDQIQESVQQSWEVQNLTINIIQWVYAYVAKQQLPLETSEIQIMMETYNLEIIDSKILSLGKAFQQNNKNLQELIEKIDKDKTLTNNQQNLIIDIQNFDEDNQLLNLQIQQHISEQEELKLEQMLNRKLLKDFNIDSIQSIQVCQENLKQQRSQLEQAINSISNQREAQRQMIITKIQEEQIQDYIEELIEQIELAIEIILPKMAYKKKQIEKKNSLLQTLEQKQDQKTQSNTLAIRDEIQCLFKEIEVLKKQIEKQQEFIGQLNMITDNNLSHEEVCELVLTTKFFDMENERQQKKQQLDIVMVDIQKIENHQAILNKQQNINDRIKSLQSKIDQSIESKKLIASLRLKKIQIIEQIDANNTINLQQIEYEYNQQQNILKDIENSIKKLKEFKINAEELLCLVQLMYSKIYFLEKNIQYNSGCDKSSLQQKLNKNENQIKQFFQIKEIVDKITDCKSQISYSQQTLNQVNQQAQSNHDCGRASHLCDQICQGCFSSIQSCKFKAGHDQLHLCSNKDHQCLNNCEFCPQQCKNQIGHDQQQPHHCGNQHACQQKCKFCNQSCDIDLSNKHEIHKCKQQECIAKCYFYFNYQKVQCNLNCISTHNQAHNYHLCGKEHQCPQLCDRPGLCFIGSYTEEIREWIVANGKFEYISFIQNAERKPCSITIQENQILHKENYHNCQKIHRCDHQCPECNAYCSKDYGHSGKHQIIKHRNKDQQYFTQLEDRDRISISINYGQHTRQYNIGDSSTPETCQQSCERRGRAHFHLIPCNGFKQCLEIQRRDLRVRHQKIPYYCLNQEQDEILCEDFWEYQNWEHPVQNGIQRDKIDLCNYYCSKCNENNFCTLQAWHTSSREYDNHQFLCQELHIFHGIDICFVVDTTESMRKHLGIVTGAISKFQTASEIYSQKDALRYSIVSYWDHDSPYDDSQIVVRTQDFTNYQELNNFIQNGIGFRYSNDKCEALFDGLDATLQLNWRDRSKKYMILITDSPPHGRLYNNYWWDNFQGGCPCGRSANNVLPQIANLDINLVILEFNQELNQTIAEFRKYINLRVLNEIQQSDYVQQLEKLICQEDRNQEITASSIRQQGK